MNLLTVYEAYKEAERFKDRCVSRRGNRYGIAVEKDEWALAWQKADRQARTFDRYLTHWFKRLASPNPFVIETISQQQWNDAVAAGKASLQCDKRAYYRGVVTVGEEKEER